MTIDRAEIKQDEFNSLTAVLSNYAPKSKKYNEAKNSLLNNAKNFYEGREKIIKGFKDGVFPLKSDDKFEEQQTSKKEPPNKPTKADFNEPNEQIIKEEADINEELLKNYFSFQKPTKMLKYLSNLNNKNKNKKLVDLIKSGLIDLKNEIKKMSEDEIKIENSYEIVEIVEKILKFNQLKQQEGKGLKILTPNQMLSRLPISLAQLKAGNNFEKLKNEIRQLLYFLYRSKKLTKKIYKSLIDNI